MTRLTKPVRRSLEVPRHGALVVILTVEGVYYREKGRRKAFLLPHGVGFMRAVQLQVAAEQAKRKMRKRRVTR